MECEKYFCIDRPKNSRSKCMKCKHKCEVDVLRIGKYIGSRTAGPYIKRNYWHVGCIFEHFTEQREHTRRITDISHIEGYEILTKEEQDLVLREIKKCEEIRNKISSGIISKQVRTHRYPGSKINLQSYVPNEVIKPQHDRNNGVGNEIGEPVAKTPRLQEPIIQSYNLECVLSNPPVFNGKNHVPETQSNLQINKCTTYQAYTHTISQKNPAISLHGNNKMVKATAEDSKSKDNLDAVSLEAKNSLEVRNQSGTEMSVYLLILGAYVYHGRSTEQYSAFLMGCYDDGTSKYSTVVKVPAGPNDQHLEQMKLDMISINGKVPTWLICSKPCIPDVVTRDPRKLPVLKISGAQFYQSQEHSAEGISIRFPKLENIEEHKTWREATTLRQLKKLYQQYQNELDCYNKDDDVIIESLDSDNDSDNLQVIGPDMPTEIRTDGFLRDSKIYMADSETLLFENNQIFKNVKIGLTDNFPDEYKEYLCQFIAGGGIILEPNADVQPTYVLHATEFVKEPIDSYKHARHITVKWLKNCIQIRELLPTSFYSVDLLSTSDKD